MEANGSADSGIEKRCLKKGSAARKGRRCFVGFSHLGEADLLTPFRLMRIGCFENAAALPPGRR